VDSSRNHLLPGSGVAQQKYGRVRRRDNFRLSQNPFQGRALAHDFFEVGFATQLPIDGLSRPAVGEVLHKGGPSKWRDAESRVRHQHPDSRAILPQILLFKRRTRSVAQTFFMSSFI
jgi:hypothetical protein